MKPVFGVVVSALAASCGASAPQKAPPKPAAEPAPAPAAAVAPAQPAFPDTPAGKTLRAWFDVFNSGDEPRMQAFVAQYKYPQPADAMISFRNMTKGFDLVSIEKSDRLELKFLVKEKARSLTAMGWLKVKDTDPAEFESFRVLLIPPGVTPEQMDPPLDPTARVRVIDAIEAKLTELYVFPDVAKKMVEAIRAHQKKGAYDALASSGAFAELLTTQLQEVSRDKHLHVEFSPMALPKDEPKPSDEEKAKFRAHLESMNCGFQKSERLDGNIGYVKFDMFGDTEICGPKATAALGSLGEVDALIFDLRDNGGGHPEMVAFVSSYLFAKKTHLNDIYERKENKTTQYWTKPDVPGAKFVKQPVFVLTSKRTFSGAEEFSYNLKNLKRATIVGETTGGGAHPTMGQRLDDHFMIGVPFARAINPITKTNWEGTGVEPDVKVAADQALDTAKKLAADRIAQQKTKKPAKK
jgi:hypothetical protein